MGSTDKNTDKSTQLYRHFDADGILLYVGISLSVVNRIGQHKQSSGWFQKITRIDVEHFASRDAAREAEALAIYREKPLHNIMRPDTLAVRKAQLVEKWAAEEEAARPRVRFLPRAIRHTKALAQAGGTWD